MKDVEIAKVLRETPQSLLNDKIDELALLLNVTTRTLRARALKGGFRTRGERADKGETAINEEALMLIAARVNATRKKGSNQFMASVKKAMEEVKREGYDVATSYGRVCSVLRERGCDKKTLAAADPHARLVSLHPNHVHQFDITNCLQWHFKHGGGLKEEDLTWLHQNHVEEGLDKVKGKNKLLRFVLIDHCSGAFFFWYYYVTGERPREGADFFLKAWSKKEGLIEKTLGVKDYNGSYQLHGLPLLLMADRGSIMKSEPIKNLMESLGIKIYLHKAHNPRAKGAVEHTMHIIGTEFESELKFKNVQDLQALNAYALDWCIKYNERLGFRGQSLTRSGLWLKIKREELRICPERDVFMSLISPDEVTRDINGAGEFSFKGKTYWCGSSDVCGKKVVVKINLKDAPKVDVHYNGRVYEAEPVETNEYGFVQTPSVAVLGDTFSRPKNSETQKLKNELERIASENYGLGFVGHGSKRISKTTERAIEFVPETKNDKVAYLKREGIEVETPNPYKPLTEEVYTPIRQTWAEKYIPVEKLIAAYIAEYGSMTAAENKKIRERYGTHVPVKITVIDIHDWLNGGLEVRANENAG